MAPKKHVLYLAGWVSKFLAFSNRRGQQDVGHTVTEFLNSLEAKKDIEDWQIRQAGEAVRLYLNHFKGNEVLNTAQGASVPKADLAASIELLAEMKRLIRLKHFAYNTEIAYLDWVERFFVYIRETTENAPEAIITPESCKIF